MPPQDRSLVRVGAAVRAQLAVADESERERCAAEVARWRPVRQRPISLASYLDGGGPAPADTGPRVDHVGLDDALETWRSSPTGALSDGIATLRASDAARVVLLDLVERRLSAHEPLAAEAEAEAARALAIVIQDRFGGKTLEVRIPPVTAVQLKALGSGPQHTRGTPPNVIEMDASTWVRLALGFESWTQVRPRVSASGSHVDDLAAMLPIYSWRR